MSESFENLKAWQKGKELCLFCYKITKKFPSYEQFELSSQIRRASISVISNIAEGMSRSSLKDKKHFLEIAIGSIFELKAQTIIAHELVYLKIEELKQIDKLATECLKLTNGYKNYLK